MWQKIKAAFERLDKFKILQLIALLWIGFELHRIGDNQPYIDNDGVIRTLERIDRTLEAIDRTITLK